MFLEAVQVACPEDRDLHFTFDGASLLRFLGANSIDPYKHNLIVQDLTMQVKDSQATLRKIKAGPSHAISRLS